MDIMIENVFVDTEDLLLEVTAVALKRKMRICLAIMVACMALFVVLAIVLHYPMLYLPVIICIFMGYKFLKMPEQAAYSNYDNKMAEFDQQIPETTVRFGDRVYVEFNEEEVDFIYEEITQVKVLKSCIVFEGRDRTWYYTPFNTFTIGSAQELLALLEERCPHLRIPKANF